MKRVMHQVPRFDLLLAISVGIFFSCNVFVALFAPPYIDDIFSSLLIVAAIIRICISLNVHWAIPASVILFGTRALVDYIQYDSFSLISTTHSFLKICGVVIILSLTRKSLITPTLVRFLFACLFVIFSASIFCISLQYIFGQSIVESFGVRINTEASGIKGRNIGLFLNLPDYGAFLFGFFILVFYSSDKSTIQRTILLPAIFCALILSTSKIYILTVGLFIFISKSIPFRIKFLALAMIFTCGLIFSDRFDLIGRVLYYADRLSFSDINPDQLDIRLKALITAFQIVLSEPHGLGLGRWGSYAAGFYPGDLVLGFPKLTLTDGWIYHVMGEMGIWGFVYFFILFNLLKVPIKIFLVLSVPLFSTMGFHDPGYFGLVLLVGLLRQLIWDKETFVK